MLATAGLILVGVGALMWPSPWADPRDVRWRERHGRRHPGACRSPASEAAVTALLLVIALRTGLPVSSALARVAEHSPADISRDLHRVLSGYERATDDPSEAWAAVPEIWQPVIAAMTVAGSAGVAPGPLLRAAASSILRRESVAQESAIGRVGVRLVLPLGLVLLPAFMGTTVLPLVLVMTRGTLGP